MRWNAIRPTGHLSDDALVAVGLQIDEDVGRRGQHARTHLASCASCAARLTELSHLLDDLRAAADETIDDVFPAERRALQRQRIARRLERATAPAGPARVLRFPALGRMVSRTRSRHRWIAAAALAGLLVGLVVGRLVYIPGVAPAVDGIPIVRSARSAAAPASRPSARQAQPSDRQLAEEAFLTEVEAALAASRITELQAIDAMTPRVIEVASNAR